MHGAGYVYHGVLLDRKLPCKPKTPKAKDPKATPEQDQPLDLLPRQYPVAFAKHLVQICENLKKHRAGCPQTSESPSGLDTLASLPSDYQRAEYENAGLWEVYNYMRGSKSLAIPEEWRCILPPGFMGF